MKHGLFSLIFASCLSTAFVDAASADAPKLPPGEVSGTQTHDSTHHNPYELPLPSSCGVNSFWNPVHAMCTVGRSHSAASDWHLSGQIFGVAAAEQGSRGMDGSFAPNHFMGEIGHSFGPHRLTLNAMLTAEKWTFRDRGAPLIFQTGEENELGAPYIDAQHPHSSPVMGLSLSDTLSLGERPWFLTFSFAPRGAAAEGPIAFMHRPTALLNPDAPLGHHVGQDSGHISSTVVGAMLSTEDSAFEASVYHGQESFPTQVELPLGSLDSFAFRVSHEFSEYLLAIGSFARVHAPERQQPVELNELRYSLSFYTTGKFPNEPPMVNALILGAVTNHANARALFSITEELLRQLDEFKLFGRFELLQRTPGELGISAADPDRGRWVLALTGGFSYRLFQWDMKDFDWGASVTKDFMPGDLIGAYGCNPWGARIFVRLSGLEMGAL